MSDLKDVWIKKEGQCAGKNCSVLHRWMRIDWGSLISSSCWTNTQIHSHNNGPMGGMLSNHGCCSSLPLDFTHSLRSVKFTLNSHVTTTIPFCQNTIFLLIFIVFLLQNMYRLFRTTTKIQYPIYMQFLLFNNQQFIRWILLEFIFLLIVSSPYQIQSIWVLVGSGGWWARYK